MGETSLNAICMDRGEPIDITKPKTFWQKVEGFERHRDQGGTNHVALRTPVPDQFLCNACMILRQNGIPVGQGSLV